MSEQTYPFSDKYMRYNLSTHRYVLTTDYLKDMLSVDIERRTNGVVQAQNAINNLLDRVSLLLYGYVYGFNNKQVLTYIIAKSPSAREIIMTAMGQQAMYVLSVGDLTLSPKAEERTAWLDISAKTRLKMQKLRKQDVRFVTAFRTASECRHTMKRGIKAYGYA